MLKFFSRLEKTRNVIILLFAVLVIFGMVFFYAPHQGTNATRLSRSEETAATVGSSTVTVGEIAMEQASRSRMYQGRIPVQTRQILDSLIGSKLTAQEAERLGFYGSDQEVKEKILEQNKPADGKPFDIKKYEQQVTEAFGSVAKYEQQVRDQIAVSKLYAFITAAVNVSEEEVLNDFKKQNTKFDLSYVTVSSAQVASTIKPSEDELKNYFEQNKQNFYISLPQKKIKYVFLNQSKVGEKMALTEEDMKAEYDALPADKKRAGIKVQQIVLKVSKPELDGEVIAKANQLVEQARSKGPEGHISDEDFAQIARGNSQDPGTAANGGWLRGLVNENKDPNDPTQKVLSLQEGTVSDPVKFGSSYYIFRRGAEVPKTYEDAKTTIQVSLRNRRSYTAAAELAQKVGDRLREVKDVDKVAAEFAAQANMSPKEMVRETDYVKKDDDVPNIGISPQFEEGIAGLENPNDVGDKIPVRDGFAIPLLLAKKDPHEASYDEVKSDVSEAYKNEQAKTKMDQIAKELAEGATSVAGLKSMAEGKGLKLQDSKDYRAGTALGVGNEAGTSEELEDAVFALKAGEVTKAPVKIGDTWFIVGLNSKLEANMDDFAKQRDQLVEQSLGMKRSQAFSDFLSEARRRYETEGRIKIYENVIQKIEAAPEEEEA
ncbi:MAG TPA: peptidyl-prolyl cis-trans isomerase [Pyrinomonadaceae bacterium]|jgi:peptidyl-prolyl cis-trans isomerase D|nr:peptidyl-prolyl cis-trans isomerase [Pyrinomonadaceae bacterium]